MPTTQSTRRVGLLPQLLTVLFLVSVAGDLNVAHAKSKAAAKAPTPQQTACIQELSSYKTKVGKPALSAAKVKSYCNKHNSDDFLACVGGTERFLQGAERAVNFCAKNSQPQARSCIQSLGSFKTPKGAQALTGVQVANSCSNSTKQAFLDCVTQNERPLGAVERAVGFCKQSPGPQTQHCVRELAGYKDSKGRPLFSTRDLAPTCQKNSTTAFLDCVAQTKSARTCFKGASPQATQRVPASKSEPKRPKYLPKKKKIAV